MNGHLRNVAASGGLATLKDNEIKKFLKALRLDYARHIV
jgi:hypothetical protein